MLHHRTPDARPEGGHPFDPPGPGPGEDLVDPATGSDPPPEPAPPGLAARTLARARARFREVVPPGWNWRRVVVGVVLAEIGAVLLLLLFMAVTGRELVVGLRPTGDGAPPTEPSEDLIIPVAGVLPEELRDTWGAARGSGRTHQGIDILAPPGTPVVAADAGVVVGMDQSAAGGVTLHQRGLDGRTIYYYAHLQRYRSGLEVSDLVRQGDTLGYVGDTGNARGTPHLHFSVSVVENPNRMRGGRHLNPYPLLADPPPE